MNTLNLNILLLLIFCCCYRWLHILIFLLCQFCIIILISYSRITHQQLLFFPHLFQFFELTYISNYKFIFFKFFICGETDYMKLENLYLLEPLEWKINKLIYSFLNFCNSGGSGPTKVIFNEANCNDNNCFFCVFPFLLPNSEISIHFNINLKKSKMLGLGCLNFNRLSHFHSPPSLQPSRSGQPCFFSFTFASLLFLLSAIVISTPNSLKRRSFECCCCLLCRQIYSELHLEDSL